VVSKLVQLGQVSLYIQGDEAPCYIAASRTSAQPEMPTTGYIPVQPLPADLRGQHLGTCFLQAGRLKQGHVINIAKTVRHFLGGITALDSVSRQDHFSLT
jgi:hypothetical protein